MDKPITHTPGHDGGIYNEKLVSFFGPWMPVYMALCITASFLPFFVFFLLGFSVASDIVFGIISWTGGWIGDFAFQKFFKRTMGTIPGWRLRFFYVWPVVCSYVMVFRPFE